jgi:mRNA interferase MazF
VNRGDPTAVASRGAYSGKPRPALIVQSDLFADLASVTVCLLTTEALRRPLVRLELEPDMDNGRTQPCQVMSDKLMTPPRSSVGQHIGRLDRDELLRVDRALALFLGIA